MRRDHRSRPDVSRLEGRLLPTAGAYPDAARSALHQSYVAQAEATPAPVAFLGDSITYLWGTQGRVGLGSAAWQADFGPAGDENFGIIGDTTANLLYRVQDGELAGRPEVAVVMIGINDLLGGATPGATAAGIAADVAAIRAESPSTDVLLMGILPTASPALNAEVAQVNRAIGTLAGPGVEFLDPGRSFLGADGADRPGLLAYGVHPSAAGYDLLAAAIRGPIDAILDPPPVVLPAKAPALAVAPPPDPSAGVLIPVDPSTPASAPAAAPARKPLAVAVEAGSS